MRRLGRGVGGGNKVMADIKIGRPPPGKPKPHTDVQLLHPASYRRALEATRCGVRPTLLLPVFELPARSSCAAVLEVVQEQGMQFELLALALSAVLEMCVGGGGGDWPAVTMFQILDAVTAGLCPLAQLPCLVAVFGEWHRPVMPTGEVPGHLRRGGGMSVHSASRSAAPGFGSAGERSACSTQLRVVFSNRVYRARAKLVRNAEQVDQVRRPGQL